MPENGTDDADEAEEPRTRQDYVVAKHDRAGKPGEGAHDPAEDFEGVGGGFDPSTLDFGPDTQNMTKEDNPVIEALPDDEGEGGRSSERCAGPTTEAMLGEASGSAYEGREALLEQVRDLDSPDVDYQAVLEGQLAPETRESERDLLRDIRDRLEKMEQGAASDEAVAKALSEVYEGEEAEGEDEAADGPDSPAQRVLEQTEKTLEMLEALRESEAEDGGQGGARKEVVVEKEGGSRVGQVTRESWQELAECLTGEAREACPVE